MSPPLPGRPAATSAPLPADPMPAAIAAAAERAARQIPPLWPLAATVAVNPYVGQAGLTLAETGALLARTGGIPMTLARDFHLGKIDTGEITEDDLAGALAASPHADRPADVAALLAAARRARPAPAPLPGIADLALEASGLDWPGLIAERIGTWAAARFDAGQALWGLADGRSLWSDWRRFALHDLTPEIHGLTGFAARVEAAPDEAPAALAALVAELGLPEAALDTVFHQALLTLGGYAQAARRVLFDAELAGGSDTGLTDLLAIRLTFDAALLARYATEIATPWARVRDAHARPAQPGADDIVDEILQEAFERAGQRQLAQTFAAAAPRPADGRPTLQAAFCIDVRSEVFRRALESLDPGIRTIGFAGFFGLASAHRRFASDAVEARHPVLIPAGVTSRAGSNAPETREADLAARYAARAKRAWGRFKLAAVSSFAFVEAMGPAYVGKLIGDALGLKSVTAPNDPLPELVPPAAPAQRLAMAETILRAMTLTGPFAPLVVIAGHGAQVVNNPHASALQCGACGGHSGEVNARLAAHLLNDATLRAGLAARGLQIPADTLFVAGLHDTVSDEVTLYTADLPADRLVGDTAERLAALAATLAKAGRLARTERALRLPRGREATLAARARDWSETRPEWGLAGAQAFIAAPRARTAGRSLAGTAFLHDYDWRADGAAGYPVLELILTAPVVVASWISLQYYGSAVAPDTFGAGNKLLHNVVGGVGVVEGNAGMLRSGLPWQSVHDGTRLMHEPRRLTVVVEAPREAIAAILARHKGVADLFDRRWLHLLVLDETGRIAWRHAGGDRFVPVSGAAVTPLRAA